jgi:hypothetical protein
MLAIGAGAALVAASARVRAERANRTVALILDYDQVRELAAIGGLTTRDLLPRLREAGATHIAITEQTLRAAVLSGELSPVSADRLAAGGDLLTRAAFVGSPETAERLHRSLTERFGRRTANLGPVTAGARRVDLRFVGAAEVLDLGIGYSLGAMQEINQAGLAFVPRPYAEGNQWQAATDAALTLAQERKAGLVIFAGTAAPGYPNNLAHVAERLREAGLLFGHIEFGKQYGDQALAARLPDRIVRVHSINETEMLGMSPARAIDRFVLGVRERNIRACYVRLFEPAGPDPVAAAAEYVQTLADRLRGHGFELGAPQPVRELGLSPVLRWLAMLGPLAAVGLCLVELLGCRPLPVVVLLGVGVGLTLVGTLAALTSMAKLCALLGAVALPTLGVGVAAARRGTIAFFVAPVLSLMAGLYIVGCLADSRFMVKLDQFSGVKAAHLLPLLAVLLLQLGWELGAPEAAEGEARVTTLLRGLRKAAEGVLRYWHVALLLVSAAALAMLVLRSGNDSGVGVSPLELQLRSVLDHVFGVRPRTKEVLIGHPFLVLALARAAAGKRQGLWALLTLATIGQVSMVNTFSHLHTPLLVSVVRTLHGLWFGALVGGVLYLVVEQVERRWPAIRSRLAPDPAQTA